MEGQLSLFPEEEKVIYPYWEWKNKEQPESINVPKCVKVSLSATHIYWYCPICRGEDSIYEMGFTRTDKLGERCRFCGQRIYYDEAEIQAAPYYQRMVARRDLVVQKERNCVFKRRKTELQIQLREGFIDQEGYKTLLKVEELFLLGKHDEAFSLKRQYEIEKNRKQNTPYLVS